MQWGTTFDDKTKPGYTPCAPMAFIQQTLECLGSSTIRFNIQFSAGDVFPPGFKGMHPVNKQQQAGADDIKKHIRPGPHPGMRAAAEMQRQQAQQGSGRGMMGVVLPMYAIGIVLYLVYTLIKVFNKSKNNSWSRIGGGYDREEQNSSVDRMGFPTSLDGSGDVRNFLNDHQQRKELEDLLTRVDEKNVSTDEMRALQKRLEETEAQMTRILQAMQSVQKNVDKISTYDGAPQEINLASSESRGDPEENAEKDPNEDVETPTENCETGEENLKENADVDFDDIDRDDEEGEEQCESSVGADEQGTEIPSRKPEEDNDSTVRQRQINKNEQ
ncbi:resistance to inhibitors of cholinesterase protein 3-like [Physella acuta]|uniref:resistance to inhibitors of cholinesterase protein 3-like n=1 Tax=Physella acuta TaxID=109671 RepID=UPI0027DD3910|nr:resistance to inhibitors of cholinesterase protein 3-like [Physella acuta]